MKRILLLLTLLFSSQIPDSAFPAQPNVLFILADDLGWADTTLYGHTQVLPDAEHRAAGQARHDLHPGLFGQSALLADALGHSHRAQPGAHGHHHAELPSAAGRAGGHDPGKPPPPDQKAIQPKPADAA